MWHMSIKKYLPKLFNHHYCINKLAQFFYMYLLWFLTAWYKLYYLLLFTRCYCLLLWYLPATLLPINILISFNYGMDLMVYEIVSVYRTLQWSSAKFYYTFYRNIMFNILLLISWGKINRIINIYIVYTYYNIDIIINTRTTKIENISHPL